MKISTVLGTIDSSELGITLMHEHVLIANHTLRIAYPKWFERDVFIQYAVRMLKNAKESGIDTIVDATPIDLGRDLSIMQEVSENALRLLYDHFTCSYGVTIHISNDNFLPKDSEHSRPSNLF